MPALALVHSKMKAGKTAFSLAEVRFIIERGKKNAVFTAFNSNGGAGMGSRTPISSLGRIHNSRYTIPAYPFIITYFPKICYNNTNARNLGTTQISD